MPELPTQEYCLGLFQQYAVPQRIRDHCLAVEVVSRGLTTFLLAAGQQINADLTERLSLVHDAFKAASIPRMRFLYDVSGESFHPSIKEYVAWAQLREDFPDTHEVDVAAAVLKRAGYFKFLELVTAIGSTANPRYLDLDSDNPDNFAVLVSHYADWRVQ